jgi:DNA polymerase III epsilon subunit-like protein
MDFVAIDFETANIFRGSPCAVGLSRVKDGAVSDSWATLIHQDEFDPFCTAIHGISAADVRDAPPFSAVWRDVYEWIGGLPLVAHNAAFDTGVIRDAHDTLGMAWPDLTYACTLVLSRRTYDLPSYRLPFVAEAAGIDFDPGDHHKALSDASLSAQIMLDIAKRHEHDDLYELARSLGLRLGTITADSWEGCKGIGGKSRSGFGMSAGDIPINPDADPDNPLYGVGVTFTGALSSMTRNLAFHKVAECGGMPLDSVSKKTNLLVFGYQDARFLAPGATLSSKFAKAVGLKAKGQDIEIIGEDDFLSMLQEAGVGVGGQP